MGDTGKFKPGDKLDELHRLEETHGTGEGRVEFDELGNAVWVPYGGLGAEETLRALLNDNTLDLSQDDVKGTARRVQANPAGLKKGYDPYDSGLLEKKQRTKNKDLRALSRWIEQKKKLDESR